MGKEYTIRCLWDTVLDDGTPPKEVVKKRELKAKKKISDKERDKDVRYSELSKEVMVWEGTVYEPRGIRRIIRNKRSIKKAKSADSSKRKTNTSIPDTTNLIFKGDINKARTLNVVSYCFEILKRIFGGLYITSNIVETIFNFKTRLYPHRTIKYGERLLVCVLYSYFVLKGKRKTELIKFLKEKVITYDFVMQKVLYGSGIQKTKQERPSYLDIIKGAISTGRKLFIHYCDRKHKHTSRIITPTKVMFNEYNNTTQVEAFCHLRKEKRTFYLERIRDVAVYNLNPIWF